MESQWLDYYTQEGFDEVVLHDMAKSYYALAQRDEDVVALISYLLPSRFDTPDQRGFLDLSEDVQQTIRNIGEAIVAPS